MVCCMLYYYYSVRQYVLSLLMSYLIEWDGVYLPCNTMKCLRCCMLYYYYSVRQYVSSLLLSSDVPIVLMAVDCTRLYAKIELPNRVWWCLFTLQYYASDW